MCRPFHVGFFGLERWRREVEWPIVEKPGFWADFIPGLCRSRHSRATSFATGLQI